MSRNLRFDAASAAKLSIKEATWKVTPSPTPPPSSSNVENASKGATFFMSIPKYGYFTNELKRLKPGLLISVGVCKAEAIALD